MIFHGLQKLTLLDFPGRTACTVFTAGCNFRCPFCHNASLVNGGNEEYSQDEILSFMKKRAGVLDGVCVTGGEPLMHDGIFGFMRAAKELGYLVKLDTNGSFPEKLERVLGEKLADYVAMDVKASEENYARAAGVGGLDISPVLESIRILKNGGTEYEFRTTAFRGIHTPEEISRICKMIEGAENYFIQNFVNSGELIDGSVCGLSKEEMENLLAAAVKIIPNARLRGV